ncbi:MAG: CPBP family intramembrane glutamic endopeptidase [Chloroflexia bacterium]
MKQPTDSKADLREALLLGVLLTGYSNGVALWAVRRGGAPDRVFQALNPVLTALMLGYASRRPGGVAEVGLRREGLGLSLAAGLGVGLGLAGPPLFFFHKPLVLDSPLEYGPISSFTRREMLVDVLWRVPVGVALLEELGFRGLLYAALRRSLPAWAAVAGSALAFGGWHFMVTATSAAQTNLGDARLPRFLKPHVQPLAVAGGMLTTGVAGLAFGALRERTGNLAGPMVAHWLVDALMTVALWRRGRSLPRPTESS